MDIELHPERSEDPLFKLMPKRFPAHVTHSQSALRLPAGAVNLAFNDFEPFHAFRIGDCAWGVQFHPEYNIDIMKWYIIQQADELKAYDRNIDEILMTVKETSDSAKIMKRFADFVMQRQKH